MKNILISFAFIFISFTSINSMMAAGSSVSRNTASPSAGQKTLNPGVKSKSIQLITPNGGETWRTNQLDTISWSINWVLTESTNFTAEISYDNGNHWRTILNISVYSGSVFSEIRHFGDEEATTDSAIVRIFWDEDPWVFDVSDGYIKIESVGGITISPPHWLGNPSYYAGSESVIRCGMNAAYSMMFDQINIDFSSDNGNTWYTIVNQALINGYDYPWIIPNLVSDSCRMRVVSISNPQNEFRGDLFKIISMPYLKIISPAENDLVRSGSESEIIFKTDNRNINSTYGIYTSPDNGAFWWYHSGFGATTVIPGTYDTSFSIYFRPPLLENDHFGIVTSLTDDVSDTVWVRLRNFPLVPICKVSTTESMKGNTISWSPTPSKYIDRYIVYKETARTGVYAEIQQLEAPGNYTYTDTSARPSVKAERYAIGYMDSQGQIYPKGEPHQTIHLNISKGINGEWNLIWSPYEGYEVESYTIYRGVDIDYMQPMATVSGNITSYTDYSNNYNTVFYMIEAVNHELCFNKFRNSISNIVTDHELGLNPGITLQGNYKVFPNPAKDMLSIKSSHRSEHVILSIINTSGMLIEQSMYNMDANETITKDISAIANGLYLLKIQNNTGVIYEKIMISH